MSQTQHDTQPPYALKSVSRSIMAGRFAYLSLGLAMAVWASLIPFAKERLGVNEAQLGMLLLCLGLGATLSMPVSGALVGRFGCRAMQCAGIPLYYLALFLLSFMPTPLTLAICLTIFGIWSGTLDVTMNIQVACLEQASGKRLMSNLHAMYMIGAAAGAGGMAVLLKLTHNPVLADAVLCVGIMAGFFCFQKYFFPKTTQQTEEKTPLIVIPTGIIFWLGFICFFLYMIEGVLMDWSALFLHEVRQVELSVAGTGYALFAVTMTLGRLAGDRLGAVLGSKRLLMYGTVLCIFCFLAICFVPFVPAIFAAFFCLGLCASNTVPMLFSLVTKNAGNNLNTGIAGVSLLGYLGLLAGPAIMGFVAHTFGLAFVFGTMAGFLALIALLLKYLRINE